MGNYLALTRRKLLSSAAAGLVIPPIARGLDPHEDTVKFKAKTLEGESLSTESVHGKIVLVQFWTTWCPYCRADAPVLDALLGKFKGDGLEILAVDVAESKKTVSKYLAQNPRQCKVVMMEDTNLAAWFSPHEFPHYVAINRNGGAAAEQKGSGGERSLRHLLREAGLDAQEDAAPATELRSSPRRS